MWRTTTCRVGAAASQRKHTRSGVHREHQSSRAVASGCSRTTHAVVWPNQHRCCTPTVLLSRTPSLLARLPACPAGRLSRQLRPVRQGGRCAAVDAAVARRASVGIAVASLLSVVARLDSEPSCRLPPLRAGAYGSNSGCLLKGLHPGQCAALAWLLLLFSMAGSAVGSACMWGQQPGRVASPLAFKLRPVQIKPVTELPPCPGQEEASSSGGTNTGAIVGGVVGGVAAVTRECTWRQRTGAPLSPLPSSNKAQCAAP